MLRTRRQREHFVGHVLVAVFVVVVVSTFAANADAEDWLKLGAVVVGGIVSVGLGALLDRWIKRGEREGYGPGPG